MGIFDSQTVNAVLTPIAKGEGKQIWKKAQRAKGRAYADATSHTKMDGQGYGEYYFAKHERPVCMKWMKIAFKVEHGNILTFQFILENFIVQ